MSNPLDITPDGGILAGSTVEITDTLTAAPDTYTVTVKYPDGTEYDQDDSEVTVSGTAVKTIIFNASSSQYGRFLLTISYTSSGKTVVIQRIVQVDPRAT